MRERWSWPGAVALVISVFVAGGWCAALVLSASPLTDTISEQGANLLSTVGGVLAGGVVTYLGSQIPPRSPRDEPPSSTDQGP